MMSPVQRPFALPGMPNLGTSDAYFIFMAGCFAATACWFLWFTAFALICFCAACLCTAFGDLSPIFFYLSAAGLVTRSMFIFPRVIGTVSSIADVVKPQMDRSSFFPVVVGL